MVGPPTLLESRNSRFLTKKKKRPGVPSLLKSSQVFDFHHHPVTSHAWRVAIAVTLARWRGRGGRLYLSKCLLMLLLLLLLLL